MNISKINIPYNSAFLSLALEISKIPTSDTQFSYVQKSPSNLLTKTNTRYRKHKREVGLENRFQKKYKS